MQVDTTIDSILKYFSLAFFRRDNLTPEGLKDVYLRATRQQRNTILINLAEAVVDVQAPEEFSFARKSLVSISSTADGWYQQRLIELSYGVEGVRRQERIDSIVEAYLELCPSYD